MDSNLITNIQDYIDKFAELISFFIKADIEIVDRELVSVARHAVFDSGSKTICAEIIYSAAIQEGSLIIVENPRRNMLCNKCLEKNRCLKKLELAFPILYNNQAQGAIGIVCYTLGQKEAITKELELFTAFAHKLTDLISDILDDYRQSFKAGASLNLMKKATDAAGKAYVITDELGNVADYNGNAAGYVSGDITKVQIVSEDSPVWKIRLNSRLLNVIGAEYEFASYKMIIFNETQEYITFQSGNIIGEAAPVFIGGSIASQRLLAKLNALAKTDSVVLISGEPGSGKEHSARLIHRDGPGFANPFVVADCRQFSGHALERDLFGSSEKGTSGQSHFPGKIVTASNSVLYLDNVEYIHPRVLQKVIDALNAKQYTPEGFKSPVSSAFRLICATTKDFEYMQQFFKQVNLRGIMPLRVPSLSQRKEDIGDLYRYFLKKHGETISPMWDNGEIITLLRNYKWPENMRELENIVRLCIVRQEMYNELSPEYVKSLFTKKPTEIQEVKAPKISDMEYDCIKKALEKHGSSTQGKKLAAKELGIGIATLYRKLREYDLK